MSEIFPQPNNAQENPKNKGETKAEKKLEDMQKLMSDIMLEAESLEIKDTDKNEQGELLVSPNGPVSNLGKQNELWWKIVRTESFKKFFGDWQTDPGNCSKIVDRNGEPMIFFRGLSDTLSLEEFYNEEYYKSKNLRGGESMGEGVHFTPKPDVAYKFASHGKNGGNIYCAFLDARRPSYSTTFIGGLNYSVKKIIYNLPDFIANKLTKMPLLNNDSVFGGTYSRGDYKQADNLYELVVNSPYSVLIVPTSIIRITEAI